MSRARTERLAGRLWFDDAPGIALRMLRALLRPLCMLTAIHSRRARHHINRTRKILADEPNAVRVLVVGNLVAGGAGKTPLTIALAAALSERGWRVGIICRGDGARQRAKHPALVNANSDPSIGGDEAVLLARNSGAPVAVGRHRAQAMALLIKTYPQLTLIISDDGLQHRALTRHLELAVFDRRGAGNGYLLPAGPLREPLAHLQQMDALVINTGWQSGNDRPTRAGPAPKGIAHPITFCSRVVVRDLLPLQTFVTGTAPGEAHNSQATLTPAAPATTLPSLTDKLPSRTVAAVAGIASPQGFFDLLEDAGLSVTPYPLGDHAAIDATLLDRLQEQVIIMTEKDAVKCQHLSDARIWVLRIRAEADRGLADWIDRHLKPPVKLPT